MPDIAYDTALDRLYVVNNPSTTSIALIDHASTANGIVVPTRTLSSPSFVSSIVSIYLDTVNDELYVADAVSGILVFSNISTATSPVPLGRTITITRGVSTIAPDDIFVDTTHDILYAKLHVGSGGVSDAIAVIDHASARNTPVTVTQELTFSTSISGIIGDGAANRLFVVDAPGSKVLVFDGASAASGVVVPTRTINTPTSLHRIALVPSSSTNRLYGVAADTRTVYIINNASTANRASATVPVTAITNPSVGSLTGLAVAQ
ncbi:MAG: hypothetical protein ABI771_16020 [Betaproteobacteria bacterium]